MKTLHRNGAAHSRDPAAASHHGEFPFLKHGWPWFNSKSCGLDYIVFTKERGLRETPIVQAKFISLLKGWVLKAGVQLSPLLVIALCKER